jgi:hypothetical protein
MQLAEVRMRVVLMMIPVQVDVVWPLESLHFMHTIQGALKVILVPPNIRPTRQG